MNNYNDKMVCVITESGIDCPEGLEVYHSDIFEARKEGVRFCKEKALKAFIVRKVNNGHYRTLGYYNADGSKITD